MTTYAPLPTTFRKDHFDFTMVNRSPSIAFYSKTKPHYSRPSYEVIVIATREDWIAPTGRYYEAHEIFPSSETWGIYAWTYTDMQDAIVKYRKLVLKHDKIHTSA